MKRKIFAGVLVLALLALPGCVAEGEPDEITLVRNSESGAIYCGPGPESQPRPSQPPESSPDDIKFRKAKGEICQLPLAPDGDDTDSSLPRVLSVQDNPIPLDAETITVFIDNLTDEEMTFGEDYWLERQNGDGEWEKLTYLPDVGWHDIAYVIQPHSTGKHEVKPVYFYGEDALQPGHYRYGNKFNRETLYAAFDFMEPGGEPTSGGDKEEAEQALKSALGGLQKRGSGEVYSRPEPSKYVQPIN